VRRRRAEYGAPMQAAPDNGGGGTAAAGGAVVVVGTGAGAVTGADDWSGLAIWGGAALVLAVAGFVAWRNRDEIALAVYSLKTRFSGDKS
ncbi:MAG: LPXTG cell wall anchor domain-containing protein, partial [Roseibium sp.]|uniref:LPXTG cell wall anchor domain-containing protein n=2 Tax=Roseibium sp. TaxID=1936156 RepID=UPI003264E5D0